MIFNFHGYPWLIHKFTYRRTNHAKFHVRGYKEKGNINTPLELAIRNQVDRFNLAIDVIDRVPKLQDARRAPEGVAEGADHREHQLRGYTGCSTDRKSATGPGRRQSKDAQPCRLQLAKRRTTPTLATGTRDVASAQIACPLYQTLT